VNPRYLVHSGLSFPRQNVLTFLHFHIGRGRVTAAVARNEHIPNLYDVGLAFCSPKDQFVKANGRRIAEERLQGSIGFGTGVHVMIIRVPEQLAANRSDFKDVIKNAIVNNVLGVYDPNVIVDIGIAPTWARKPDMNLDAYDTADKVRDLRRFVDAYERAHFDFDYDFMDLID